MAARAEGLGLCSTCRRSSSSPPSSVFAQQLSLDPRQERGAWEERTGSGEMSGGSVEPGGAGSEEGASVTDINHVGAEMPPAQVLRSALC